MVPTVPHALRGPALLAAFATGRRGAVAVGDVLLLASVVALVVTQDDRFTARGEACAQQAPGAPSAPGPAAP